MQQFGATAIGGPRDGQTFWVGFRPTPGRRIIKPSVHTSHVYEFREDSGKSRWVHTQTITR